jgi:hypothetical protein
VPVPRGEALGGNGEAGEAPLESAAGAQVDAVLEVGLEAAGHVHPAAAVVVRALDALRRRAPSGLADLHHRRPAVEWLEPHLEAGLLISRREGRQRWNYLDVMPIVEIHERWISPYAASAVQLLARMKRELEAAGGG